MTQGRRGGQQRFEDIVLLLPDEEYEYGERELERGQGEVGREQRSENYEIKEEPTQHFPDGKVD